MAKVSDLKHSKYLTKEDCGPQGLKLIIEGWDEKDVSMDSEPTDIRHVLKFKGSDKNGNPVKDLVLNLTNGERIQAVTGSDDLDDWIGHEIILYNDPDVSFAGKRVGGIRVFVPQKTPGIAEQSPVTNSKHIGDGPPPPTDDDVPPPTDDDKPQPGDDVPF